MAVLELGLAIVSLICGVIIIIDAFEDEIWKGILSILFWPYLVYYGFAEFEHDHKVLILVCLLASGLGRIGLIFI